MQPEHQCQGPICTGVALARPTWNRCFQKRICPGLMGSLRAYAAHTPGRQERGEAEALSESIAAHVEEARGGGDANEMWERCGLARGSAVEPK
jgi:hypothetical protein